LPAIVAKQAESRGAEAEVSIVVKNQAAPRAKKVWKLPDAVIARRYLDLQRLCDKVKKAEAKCTNWAVRI